MGQYVLTQVIHEVCKTHKNHLEEAKASQVLAAKSAKSLWEELFEQIEQLKSVMKGTLVNALHELQARKS